MNMVMHGGLMCFAPKLRDTFANTEVGGCYMHNNI